MKFKTYQPIISSFLVALVAFVVHKLVLVFIAPENFENTFIYSLPILYVFFFLYTIIILLVLIKINQVSINYVGFSFMFLTSLKMGIAYFFMQPILNSQSVFAGYEKINFFSIFILFLIIETTITIRILNNKQ